MIIPNDAVKNENIWCISSLVTENEFLCYAMHRPLARYEKLRVAHAPGMPGTFSPPHRVGDPDMHHGTCVTHVPWWMPGSLTSGFLWYRWRGKRSRHSRHMHNLQFYVSGKRPIVLFLKRYFAENNHWSLICHCHQGQLRVRVLWNGDVAISFNSVSQQTEIW